MHERVTDELPRVVRASREIEAPAERIFELIADPAQQPGWDGNDNLAESEAGQRVHAVGDVFTTTLTNGWIRENRVVEFEEARRVAWRPSEPGKQPPGHLWRWELNPISETRTAVTHTYDWSELDPDDTMRNERARAMTADNLAASLENLARVAELPRS
ncbi:transcriptional regulator [Streptomyces sp. AA4]|nr:transcriptional regulator [Streptomyces sp. AA4]